MGSLDFRKKHPEKFCIYVTSLYGSLLEGTVINMTVITGIKAFCSLCDYLKQG